jgi:hypothetical protein
LFDVDGAGAAKFEATVFSATKVLRLALSLKAPRCLSWRLRQKLPAGWMSFTGPLSALAQR